MGFIFLSGGGGGGGRVYFWEVVVVVGVHRPPHLIFTLFQSNTVWHEIFAGSNFCGFCDFFRDPQNKVPGNKKYSKHFPSKIYSRVNILSSL